MENFLFVMNSAYSLLSRDMVLYGFSFSFFDIFIWSAAAGITLAFIGGFFK